MAFNQISIRSIIGNARAQEYPREQEKSMHRIEEWYNDANIKMHAIETMFQKSECGCTSIYLVTTRVCLKELQHFNYSIRMPELRIDFIGVPSLLFTPIEINNNHGLYEMTKIDSKTKKCLIYWYDPPKFVYPTKPWDASCPESAWTINKNLPENNEVALKENSFINHLYWLYTKESAPPKDHGGV
jgi:hypothetical protein